MPDWLVNLLDSPWLYVAVFGLVVADAFVVVLPSETAVVALGALAMSTGSPDVRILVPVAAIGAIAGDSLLYLIGRHVSIDRWRWMRRPRPAAAFARVRRLVLLRPSVLIFTARYIPFARIAVNLSAGVARLPYRRFLPLSVAAGCGWALYNTGIGALFGATLSHEPFLAVLLSAVVAGVVGVTVDLVVSRIAGSSERRPRERRWHVPSAWRHVRRGTAHPARPPGD